MIGRQIGRYRIDEEVGRGGMGIVYRGTQVTLDRTVAIKSLYGHLADAETLGRFRREALTLARIDHPNIVHVYDIDELDGDHFIVMEFVGGDTLGAVMKAEGPMSPARATGLMAQVAAGLEAAHRQGVIHRDIKPDNVLFNEQGVAKLTDFGIAHMRDAGAKTRTGVMLGTPYYMSPEQARGKPVSPATDIYAAGVLLYEMLAGKVPFTAADPLSLALKHIQEEPPPLADARPDLPADLCDLVHRAMAKNPAERFQSAAAFRDSLLMGSWSPGRTTLDPGSTLAPSDSRAAMTLGAAGSEPALATVGAAGAADDLGSSGSFVPNESAARDRLTGGINTGVQTAGAGVDRLKSSLSTPSFKGLPRAFWIGIAVLALGGAGVGASMLTGGDRPPAQVEDRSEPDRQLPSVENDRSPVRGGGTPVGGDVRSNRPSQPAVRATLTEEQMQQLDGLRDQGDSATGRSSGPAGPTGPTPETRTPETRTPDPVQPDRRQTEPATPERDPEPDPDPQPAPGSLAHLQSVINAIMSRQERATEQGDLNLYVRDVHPDVRDVARQEFQAALQAFQSFESEWSNVRIEMLDDGVANVTYRLRMSGVARQNGQRVDLANGDQTFIAVFERGQWWIAEW